MVPIFDQLELVRDLEPQRAALNMAIDEALLEQAMGPVLRTYRWQRPALSFGYFGLFADVSEQANDHELVRRWTGGGIVPHGKDITYSIVIPRSHQLFAKSSLEIYSLLHRAIREALATKGVEADLASIAGPKISENCFANPVRADLLIDGRKIAGAAHRRNRAGLLHQGSIQLPNFSGDFVDVFAGVLCHRLKQRPLSQELLERAITIEQAKYGTEQWLKRR